MNGKIYRCGYCGCPTNETGMPISGELFQRIVSIIEKYGDGHTSKTHGECCAYEQENNRMRVTRDMAFDAGDLSLEGQYI